MGAYTGSGGNAQEVVILARVPSGACEHFRDLACSSQYYSLWPHPRAGGGLGISPTVFIRGLSFAMRRRTSPSSRGSLLRDEVAKCILIGVGEGSRIRGGQSSTRGSHSLSQMRMGWSHARLICLSLRCRVARVRRYSSNFDIHTWHVVRSPCARQTYVSCDSLIQIGN